MRIVNKISEREGVTLYQIHTTVRCHLQTAPEFRYFVLPLKNNIPQLDIEYQPSPIHNKILNVQHLGDQQKVEKQKKMCTTS